jgi:farnesyl diphosphate synthase
VEAGVNERAFAAWCEQQRGRVETALADWIPVDAPAHLGEVMRYAALGAGKRLRPLLVLAAARAVGGLDIAALRAACAVEVVHAYSLVHDDLPCMDNDRLRRGQPTAHVRYGEARALLAGDALQAFAFEILTPADDTVPLPLQARLCSLLARAAGTFGMAGGQAIDLASVNCQLTEPELRTMHRLKTGALLKGSVRMGAATAIHALSAEARDALDNYGDAIGLAYQVVDDILDVTANTGQLGKTAGKDAATDKPTYVSLLGLDGARALVERLYQDAMRALDLAAPLRVDWLRALAGRVVHRER